MIPDASGVSYDIVAFAEGLARIAASGAGPRALAAHLAATLEAAVLVEDAEWRHVALAGASERAVPGSVREFVKAGRAEKNGATMLLQRAGGSAPAVALQIRAGDITVGTIAVFADQPLSLEAASLLRLTAASIAVEMARDASGGRRRRRSFWERLVAGAFDDPIEAKDDAASRGIALAPAYVVVAVEAEGLEEATASAKRSELQRICHDVLRSGNGELGAVDRVADIVFLCPVPLEVDVANARTAATLIPRAAAKAHFGARIVGGVGCAAEPVHIARSVQEARDAMFITRRLFGGSRVTPYESLGAYPLLLRGGVSADELRRFADRVLDPLRAYDEKHQTELVRTLRLYFDVGQNVKTAAAQANVHRHTIVYRLRQIGDISGCALDNPHDQLTLRTAVAIDALGAHER
ncbi:MAG: helix-turn-helix domain-containing protein [Candidatus Eremiobacteraeota bacterium]|nr:helix-turn-helix domain-containing protein [Candidatus Eremiobacteraeota bacterium]MBV9647487.1 helix-turn-helix domain-containing protein [Candidatus Eremiobacteraeota bacterium]